MIENDGGGNGDRDNEHVQRERQRERPSMSNHYKRITFLHVTIRNASSQCC
ncbi:hypothetical protein RDWZM_009173, partial [Blomia tropicalis]